MVLQLFRQEMMVLHELEEVPLLRLFSHVHMGKTRPVYQLVLRVK